MQASSKRTGGVRGKRVHGALIAGQIALTLVLLAAAGAAIEGFLHLMHTNLGYEPHNTMSVGIPVHENTYTTWEARVQYFDNLRQKVAALPSVASIGISTNATPPNNGWDQKFEILGSPAAEEQRARVNFVGPGYFPVLEIRCCKAGSGMKRKPSGEHRWRLSTRTWRGSVGLTAMRSATRSSCPT